jgi:hypothetical protein
MTKSLVHIGRRGPNQSVGGLRHGGRVDAIVLRLARDGGLGGFGIEGVLLRRSAGWVCLKVELGVPVIADLDSRGMLFSR